jgi:hypothetical protein
MSYLDTFCISHFEEREEYSRMTEKGLELDKADFAVNGYEVVEEKYPRHGPKDASSSGRGKMKMDDAMTVDLSEEESDDDDDDLLLPRQENTAAEPIPLESSEDEDEEAHSEGQSVPLIGSRLGAMSVGKEENEELARARGQATPRKLFVSLSQPSPLILDERAGPHSHRRHFLSIRPIRGGVNVLLKVRIGAGRELWMTRIRQC